MKSKIIPAILCAAFLGSNAVYGQVKCPDLAGWDGKSSIDGWNLAEETPDSSVKWVPHDAWIFENMAQCNFVPLGKPNPKLHFESDNIILKTHTFAGGTPTQLGQEMHCPEGGCVVRLSETEDSGIGYHCKLMGNVFPLGCDFLLKPPPENPAATPPVMQKEPAESFGQKPGPESPAARPPAMQKEPVEP